MAASVRSTLLFSVFCFAALASGGSVALSQSPTPQIPSAGEIAVPDDMLTLVVGTRFIRPTADNRSPRALFEGERIPLSAFNETDKCIDQQALEVAKEYFTSLGRLLGKAGFYYFVPDEAIQKSLVMCERLGRKPPQAWIGNGTKIIAFGRVVPTIDAPALEDSIR
jgi:hypothetical protein